MACNSVHSCDVKTYDMKYVITSLKHDYQCRPCHIRLSRTHSLTKDCHNVRYPSKAHLRFKPNEIFFFHISSHPFMLPNHFQIVHSAWQYHIWEICYSRTSFRKAWFRIRFAGISCIHVSHQPLDAKMEYSSSPVLWVNQQFAIIQVYHGTDIKSWYHAFKHLVLSSADWHFWPKLLCYSPDYVTSLWEDTQLPAPTNNRHP